MTASIFGVLAEHFKFHTSPIRPSADDITIVRDQLLSLKKPLRGILLGVTKEFAELASDEINIIAVEKSVEMIEHEWIGNDSNRTVKNGDWFDLPSIATNMDFVIGDGVFTVVDQKSQHRLMDCVRSVLADDGLFILRVFCSPEIRQSWEQIYLNTTSNFSAFKSRLARSICDSKFEVRVGDVLERFKEVISPADIAHFGWTKESLSTIEAFENSPYVLTFGTEAKFIELCDEHGMKIINKYTGSYELSELCPTFVLRKA